LPQPIAAPNEPSHHAMEQAAEWYALLGSEEATEHDQRHWLAWLEQDPEHQQAWQYVESISRRFEPLQSTPDPRRTAEGLWEANTRLLQRRQVLAGIAGLAGAGLLGWGAWRHTPLPLMARHRRDPRAAAAGWHANLAQYRHRGQSGLQRPSAAAGSGRRRNSCRHGQRSGPTVFGGNAQRMA